MLDATHQPGRWYYKSCFIQRVSDEAVETMLAGCRTFPAPLSRSVIEASGGAVTRVGEDEMAYQHRHGHYNMIVISGWAKASDDDRNIQWARATMHAMQALARESVYVNYRDAEEGGDRVRAAYGVNYARLVALKHTYDPTNLFRLNQNIPPAK
jgi:FAD/FMN-containing dehydrogenase